MEERRGTVTAVFGLFAVFGVAIAVISYAVTTQVEDEVRSVFMVVAVIAVVLAALTGYVAVAAWRRWWPLHEPPIPSTGGSAPQE